MREDIPDSPQTLPSDFPNLKEAMEHLNFSEHTFFVSEISPLSQHYKAEFYGKDGVVYNCAEQYMMYQKALLFGDMQTAEEILKEDNPREQKKLGRAVTPFDQATWDRECMRIVLEANYAKFSQNPELLEQLLATAGTLIVEANPRDDIWGIGMSETQARKVTPEQWRGQNLLGKILTILREQFIQEQA